MFNWSEVHFFGSTSYEIHTLSDLCIDKIRHNSVSLWTRYCLDFIISHFIIAPAVIAFWRGTWDHSTIYWKTVFGDVSESILGLNRMNH